MRLFLLASVLLIVSQSVTAQENDADALLAEALTFVETEREAWFSRQLNMTDQERIAFWPVYDEYRDAMRNATDQLVALVESYSETWTTLSDDDALEMIDDYYEFEQERLRVRQRFLRRFDDVLPPKKLARFVQLENRFKVAVDLQLAETVPLVE